MMGFEPTTTVFDGVLPTELQTAKTDELITYSLL